MAHLINVINFSKRFDPFLSNLNMAEYKGQNPLQLLVSVPGVTGCFMLIILLLMSLSSINIIRNSSFDLFQIFHRLSIVFVLLLVLHPSSHVLKEQSNVALHHPDFCYQPLNDTRNSSLTKEQNNSFRSDASSANSSSSLANRLSNSRKSLKQDYNAKDENQRLDNQRPSRRTNGHRLVDSGALDVVSSEINSNNKTTDHTAQQDNRRYNYCFDARPTFVAQSSICWYVLSVGLSCYLLDLILRRLRRSKCSIELIEAKTSSGDNLVELVLCSNHKRFNDWLPGQFVYLNCPQIATYEWHPFTISSMDNDKKQFTLHIKTGGDWTRQLKDEIEVRNLSSKPIMTSNTNGRLNSLSMSNQIHQLGLQASNKLNQHIANRIQPCNDGGYSSKSHYQAPCTLLDLGQDKCFGLKLSAKFEKSTCQVVAGSDCVDQRTGRLQVECKRIVHTSGNFLHCFSQFDYEKQQLERQQNHGYCFEQIHSSNLVRFDNLMREQSNALGPLELYVDGPFHSPFERLLEQQVSICIANGVGWTAFSSIFQRITSQLQKEDHTNWWSQWSKFSPAGKKGDQCPSNSPNLESQNGQSVLRSNVATSKNVLHLIVIVTTMEQLKPFYKMASDYFRCLQAHDNCTRSSVVNEVTVFVTRSTRDDDSVRLFCKEEDLSPPSRASTTNNCDVAIEINEIFSIKFGKPNFDHYLRELRQIYSERRKISVYCCGSYQVKRLVEEICRDLNCCSDERQTKRRAPSERQPVFCYHEENF